MGCVRIADTNGRFKHFLVLIFLCKEGGLIKDIRCKHCGQLLLKADIAKGEIKCPRCKKIIKLDVNKDRA